MPPNDDPTLDVPAVLGPSAPSVEQDWFRRSPTGGTVYQNDWFRRFPNGGTVYQHTDQRGGENGDAGNPSKK